MASGSPVLAGSAVRFVARVVPLALGSTMGILGVANTNLSKISGLGLLPAIPPVYEAGIAVLIWGALWNVGPSRTQRLILMSYVGALIVLLHGLPGIIEPNPRFSTAWLHVGFIQYIASGRGLLLRLDARFSWAGFFSGGAVFQRAAGTTTTLWLIRFFPVAFALFACLAIWLVGRTLRFTVVQRQLAMLIFVVFNWSAQDYFSPQASAYCLYFTLCAVALTVFAGPGLRAGKRLARWLRPEHMPELEPLNTAQRTAVYLAFVAVVVAITMTHELTPGFVALAFLLFALTGSTRLKSFSFVVGLIAAAWVCFAAEAYWTGHFGKLTGGLGAIGNLVQANIGKRASGGTLERKIVVVSRIGMAGAVWAAGGLAAIILWRRRRSPLAALCLFGAGFPLLVLQPYGGEMLIRVFAFSLPAVGLLIATLIVPKHLSPKLQAQGVTEKRLRFRRRRVVAGVLMAVAIPGFLLARFGNESYERITSDDRATVDYLYKTVPTDSVIYIEDRQALLSSQRVGDVRFLNLNSVDPHQVEAQIRSSVGRQVGTYILLTESEQAYADQVFGFPPTWVDNLVHALLANGGYDIEFKRGTSLLIRAVVPIPAPAVPRGVRER